MLKRVWFTEEMKEEILAGRKTATTRDHPLDLAEYLAVSGSRYRAKPFAVIEIQDRFPTIWATVAEAFYEYEGFDSTVSMLEFLWKKRLMKSTGDKVYFHQFKVLSKDPRCPTHKAVLVENPEDSSKLDCPVCGYGFSYKNPVIWFG